LEANREEKKLLRYTYLLCLVCFLNLAIIKQPFDRGAMVMALVVCLLVGYSYFVIRKFFADGDKYIFIFSSILSVIGMVMLYRINMAYSIKQVIWFAIGVTGFILIVILLPDLKSFSKYKYFYLLCTIICMGMASIIGKEINGSKDWVAIGRYSFQPSEFGKLFLVTYLASALKDYKSFKHLIEPGIVVMICMGFMVIQKDLGFVLIFFSISLTMLYIATSKLRYIITCFILSIPGSMVAYKLFAHLRTRVLIWQNPWPYISGKS
jgi:cell division protein FtsW (lipid II flippase)